MSILRSALRANIPATTVVIPTPEVLNRIPKRGKALLPRLDVNVRRVEVDNSGEHLSFGLGGTIRKNRQGEPHHTQCPAQCKTWCSFFPTTKPRSVPHTAPNCDQRVAGTNLMFSGIGRRWFALSRNSTVVKTSSVSPIFSRSWTLYSPDL